MGDVLLQPKVGWLLLEIRQIPKKVGIYNMEMYIYIYIYIYIFFFFGGSIEQKNGRGIFQAEFFFVFY